MDGFTTSILASATYSLISSGATLTISSLKKQLKKWLLSDSDLDMLCNLIQQANINEDWSEKKIEKHFNSDPKALEIVSKVKPSQSIAINQNHFGTGNNEATINL